MMLRAVFLLVALLAVSVFTAYAESLKEIRSIRGKLVYHLDLDSIRYEPKDKLMRYRYYEEPDARHQQVDFRKLDVTAAMDCAQGIHYVIRWHGINVAQKGMNWKLNGKTLQPYDVELLKMKKIVCARQPGAK